MSELQAMSGPSHTSGGQRSLWVVAAVILSVVFAPALIAWGLTLLKP